MPSLLNCNRVLKCEVIKIIFLKLWDLSDILKEQRPKTSILSTQKNLEGFWSYQRITGLRSQKKIASKC